MMFRVLPSGDIHFLSSFCSNLPLLTYNPLSRAHCSMRSPDRYDYHIRTWQAPPHSHLPKCQSLHSTCTTYTCTTAMLIGWQQNLATRIYSPNQRRVNAVLDDSMGLYYTYLHPGKPSKRPFKSSLMIAGAWIMGRGWPSH